MEMKTFMERIVSLILSIFMITSINLCSILFCNWYGCYHWTNLFNHNLVCHGCIDGMRYIKDYQLFVYMTLGTLLTREIKNMIDSINPFNFKYNEEETKIPQKNKKDEKKNENKFPEYELGKTSPHPRSFIENTRNPITREVQLIASRG